MMMSRRRGPPLGQWLRAIVGLSESLARPVKSTNGIGGGQGGEGVVESAQSAVSDTVEAARAGYENLTSSAQGGAEDALNTAQDTLDAASATKDQLLNSAQGGVNAAGAALESAQDSIGSSVDSVVGAYEAAADAIPPEVGEFFEFVVGKAADNPEVVAGVGAIGTAYAAIPALVQMLRKTLCRVLLLLVALGVGMVYESLRRATSLVDGVYGRIA